MPRLANTDYLNRHYFVAALWNDPEVKQMFTHLSPHEQWDVHRFYQTIANSPKGILLQTRASYVETEPSLPQRSGRAFSELLTHYTSVAKQLRVEDLRNLERSVAQVSAAWRSYQSRSTAPNRASSRRAPISKGRHRVSAVVKPEVDGGKLAEVLLVLAMHLKENKGKDRPN